ncbi:MAG: type II secretion system GspH family protein [Polyangiaceae bacterium]|nr:type II secretion system GspH family protein [Polyangiaceae bacterium]
MNFSLRQRGFTLVELMVTVVIISILIGVAVIGIRQQRQSAKSAEPRAVIRAVGSAQEVYRAEHLAYLDVSSSMTDYYPTGAPQFNRVFSFYGWSGSTAENWERLEPVVDFPVEFGYVVRAGLPATSGIPVPAGASGVVAGAPPPEPWFIVEAVGDLDGDGIRSYFTTTSFTTNVVEVRPGE